MNSNGMLVTVYQCRENHFSIICTDNKDIVEDFRNPLNSDESNRDEFEKVYGYAQYLLTKANIEQ